MKEIEAFKMKIEKPTKEDLRKRMKAIRSSLGLLPVGFDACGPVLLPSSIKSVFPGWQSFKGYDPKCTMNEVRKMIGL